MLKLQRDFYAHHDVVEVAKKLLGKFLCTKTENVLTAGMIVETEAYNGRNDKACHAHIHGKTERTKIMYGKPGLAYVYLCYGIHHLFNVVTNKKDFADAILIRAIEPSDGIQEILTRREHKKLQRSTGGGPGIVSQALGITTNLHYGEDLTQNTIWIEDRNFAVPDKKIIASPRVGVDYAGEDAMLPWRFRLKNNRFTSPAK